MYALALITPDQPTERRTATTGGEIRTAVWDLLRSRGVEIKDEHHSDLMYQAGAARDKADVEGFAALVFEGVGALTLHTR
jgi:hypothetical protein